MSIAELLKVGRALRVARRLDKALRTVTDIPLLSEAATRLYFEEELEKTFSTLSFRKRKLPTTQLPNSVQSDSE